MWSCSGLADCHSTWLGERAPDGVDYISLLMAMKRKLLNCEDRGWQWKWWSESWLSSCWLSGWPCIDISSHGCLLGNRWISNIQITSNLQIIYNIQSEISRIFNPKCLEYLEHGHLLGNRCIFSASLVFLKLCCSFELKYDREDIKKGVFS